MLKDFTSPNLASIIVNGLMKAYMIRNTFVLEFYYIWLFIHFIRREIIWLILFMYKLGG